MLDLIIIGAGPAGLSACLYASRAGLDVLIFDMAAPGGKLNVTAQIENYPGLKPTPGPEIAFTMYESALSFGAKMEYGEVLDIKDHGDYKEVVTTKQTYQAKYVLIATGTKERQMNLEKENELVAHCVIGSSPINGKIQLTINSSFSPVSLFSKTRPFTLLFSSKITAGFLLK